MLLFCRIINIFRLFLYPFFSLFRFTRQRVQFESKNLQEESCQSFRRQNLKAHYAFEISSEGELEQVFHLIEHLLQEKKRIELMFASESVEKKCQRLYQGHPKQLRLLRLPLASFSLPASKGKQTIPSWASAPILILCRYDFYPELLLYGCAPRRRLVLVSATFKNKENVPLSTFLWNRVYRFFDRIVCVSQEDQTKFESMGIPSKNLRCYNFRNAQIIARLKNKETKLAPWKDFTSWCNSFSKNHRLIIGSAWPYEMNILKSTALQQQIQAGVFLIMIAPHRLNSTFITEIEEKIPKSLPIYSLKHPSDMGHIKEKWKQNPGPLLFTAPGILLEFYSLFGHAVVGGGHQHGVHSLLEPFWAGCRISCGPRVERSTEYTFLKELPFRPVQIVEQWEKLSSLPQIGQERIPYDTLETQALHPLDSMTKWSLLKPGTEDA